MSERKTHAETWKRGGKAGEKSMMKRRKRVQDFCQLRATITRSFPVDMGSLPCDNRSRIMRKGQNMAKYGAKVAGMTVLMATPDNI